MSQKDDLLDRIKSRPKDFTVKELDSLMAKCGCTKQSGGRGSALKYVHSATNRVLIFDGPHPENELYSYQIKKVLKFLIEVGEISQ